MGWKGDGKKIGLIDQFIGRRIRIKRIELGISQAQLGRLLNLTFQQIQKCEKGVNRTPAGRLYKISKIFRVSVNYFFEGLDDHPQNAHFKTPTRHDDTVSYCNNRNLNAEIVKLNTLFRQIKERKNRRLIIELVKCFTIHQNKGGK